MLIPLLFFFLLSILSLYLSQDTHNLSKFSRRKSKCGRTWSLCNLVCRNLYKKSYNIVITNESLRSVLHKLRVLKIEFHGSNVKFANHSISQIFSFIRLIAYHIFTRVHIREFLPHLFRIPSTLTVKQLLTQRNSSGNHTSRLPTSEEQQPCAACNGPRNSSHMQLAPVWWAASRWVVLPHLRSLSHMCSSFSPKEQLISCARTSSHMSRPPSLRSSSYASSLHPYEE